MTSSACPCCNTQMAAQGDAVGGHIHHCGYCFGILATDRWLNSNMRQVNLRNLRKGVFDGQNAGYRCPACEGEMVKGPVPTNQGSTIEVDGCLKCGSLWFDNKEMEPFFPQIQELNLFPDSNASKATKNAMHTFLNIISTKPISLTLDAFGLLKKRKEDDSEE